MDEVQRLLLQVVGQDKLQALNKELDAENKLLRDQAEQLRLGTINQVQFSNAVFSSASKAVALNTEIAKLTRETKNYSQSALQLGYVIDDLANTSGDWTRKLAAISNNLPGLIMSLGAGAGLAGVLGIVGTALIALAPMAKAAYAAMTGNEAELAKDKLKEIEDHLKKVRDEFAKLRDMPTGAEKTEAEKLSASAATPRPWPRASCAGPASILTSPIKR